MSSDLKQTEWRIDSGRNAVTAVADESEHASGVYVCAHGAGGSISEKSMIDVSATFRKCGLTVVRFNFPYRERGSSAPDPMPVLEQCFSAVLDRVRIELNPKRMYVGGRSMGGRAASMLAAKGLDAEGLILLAYPLHPPGQPEKARDAHLSQISLPVLCFNGTRDSFCTPELMDGVVGRLGSNWTMHWLDGADHGFKTNKASGRSYQDVLDEVATASATWLASR